MGALCKCAKSAPKCAQMFGRTWARLGALGRTWARLGALGRAWARMGAVGRTRARMGARFTGSHLIITLGTVLINDKSLIYLNENLMSLKS